MTTQLQFVARDDYVVYHVSSSVTGGVWRIYPSLPEGIAFSQEEMTISGYPLYTNETKEYTISVESTVVVNATFTLSVVTCPSGYYYHILNKGSANMTIYYNAAFLRNVTLSSDRDLCLYEDNLDLTVYCLRGASYSCSITIYGEDQLLMLHIELSSYESSQYKLSYHSEGAPVFTVPEFLTGLPNKYSSFSIPISDHYYPVVIEAPAASPTFFWNDVRQSLSATFSEGVYTYTMTASNEKGSTKALVNIYINQCPSHLSYLRINCPKTYNEYLYIYDLNNNLVFSDYINGQFDKIACLPSGNYYLNITEDNGVGGYTMYFLDELGDIEDMLVWENGGSSQSRMITVGDDIPYGSSLKYMMSDNPDKKWNTKKYNDKKWNEGTSGNWGSFSQSSVYFRKQFSISDISKVSIVHVTIQAHDNVIVFLNGVKISEIDMASRNVSSARTTVPSDMLSKGTNVVCVCLMRTASTEPTSAIEFDLKVKTIPAENLLRSYSGTASDQPTQTKSVYAAQHVFEDKNTWKSAAVPVNLTYLFTGGDQSWINQISFYARSVIAPVDFMIQGLVTTVDKDGNSTIVQADDLRRVRDENFLYMRDTYTVDFSPSRAYNGFRFVFYQGYNSSQYIELERIKFYVRSNKMCKGSLRYKETRVGDSIIKNCPFRYVGHRTMYCRLDSEMKPVWETDDSMCINRYAPKGVSYVDTVFTVGPLPDDYYSTLLEKINEIILANLTVWENEISYPVVKSLNIDGSLREVTMRFSVEEELGDYVEKKLIHILPRLGEECIDKMDKRYLRLFTVQFDQNPTYRYPFPWHMVWWIVVGVVFYIATIVISVFCTHLSIRSNITSGKVPAVKRLKKSKHLKQEEEVLLQM